MAAPLDAPWAGENVTATSLDKTTYGQGSTFPSTWQLTRLFWHTGNKSFYYNRNTEGSPLWERLDTPIGTITMYGGAEADVPSGWLLCDGQAVSRTSDAYTELFDRLGTEYGVGDGSTTFNVPDFQTSNSFPRGVANDAARGETGGESTHALTIAELASHTHIQDSHSHTTAGRNAGASGTTIVELNADTTQASPSTSSVAAVNQTTGSGTAHENKPPYLGVHYIIAV